MIDLDAAVTDIQRSKVPEDVFGHFAKALGQYGYDNVIYSLMNDHHSIGQKALHGFSTSYPEDWLRHYAEHSYEKYDPVFYGVRQVKPFYWSEAVSWQKHDPALDAIFLKTSNDVMHQAEDAGLADGIGVSFCNQHGEKVGIGISRSKSNEPQKTRELADIYLISAAFHETYLNLFQTDLTLKFTAREMDVLSWSAEGLQDDSIADKLGLTTHTIRFHWNNILRKTGVRSKLHATMIAVTRKLVVPKSLGSSLS